MNRRRPGYTLFQLVVLLALLLLLLALLLPAVQKVRLAAARMNSMNNLKMLALGVLNYESTQTKFPAGVDANHFSGLARLLPYLDQDALFRDIDWTKSALADANASSRAMRVKVFESPLDLVIQPDQKAGPTNYFLIAGSKFSLADNDGIFYRDSAIRLADITDGTSNTAMTIELLKGDGSKTARDVRRQHVQLKKEDLKGLKESAGVQQFRDDTNIVGTRGSSWLDGRFLQSTTNLTRDFNDSRPDVDCGGEGGLAAPRSLVDGTPFGMVDGSVRFLSSRVTMSILKTLATRNGGEVLPPDF